MTTQPYDPPSIAPITLASQTRIVHEARRRRAVANGMHRHRSASPAQAMEEAIAALRDDAELAVLQEEDTLRALAVAAFHATGQSAVSPGITVTEDILARSTENLHPQSVRTRQAPAWWPSLRITVTLADDLGAALDAAVLAQTPATWRGAEK